MHTIYDRIKKMRERRGLTQAELATAVGYTSRSSINKIEAGLIDIPQSKIEIFAKVLEVSPAYLMGWEENEESFNGHYLNPDAAAYAEECRTNPNIRVLFSTVKDISKESMEDAIKYIEFLKSKEKPQSQEDFVDEFSEDGC